MASFGKNLQQLREQAGLSQAGLAQRAGISVKSVQNWEINRTQPRVNAIVRLAQALDISLDSLVGDLPAATKSDGPSKRVPQSTLREGKASKGKRRRAL